MNILKLIYDNLCEPTKRDYAEYDEEKRKAEQKAQLNLQKMKEKASITNNFLDTGKHTLIGPFQKVSEVYWSGDMFPDMHELDYDEYTVKINDHRFSFDSKIEAEYIRELVVDYIKNKQDNKNNLVPLAAQPVVTTDYRTNVGNPFNPAVAGLAAMMVGYAAGNS
jgi:hypothetical protein